MHNDDTSMRVLSLGRNRGSDAEVSPEPTGVFTSGIISFAEGTASHCFSPGVNTLEKTWRICPS
jgi:hypothetical protein